MCGFFGAVSRNDCELRFRDACRILLGQVKVSLLFCRRKKHGGVVRLTRLLQPVEALVSTVRTSRASRRRRVSAPASTVKTRFVQTATTMTGRNRSKKMTTTRLSSPATSMALCTVTWCRWRAWMRRHTLPLSRLDAPGILSSASRGKWRISRSTHTKSSISRGSTPKLRQRKTRGKGYIAC